MGIDRYVHEYKVSDELIHADVAKEQAFANANGLFVKIKQLDNVIRQAVAAGRSSVVIQDVSEDVLDVLRMQGYKAELIFTDNPKIINRYMVAWY